MRLVRRRRRYGRHGNRIIFFNSLQQTIACSLAYTVYTILSFKVKQISPFRPINVTDFWLLIAIQYTLYKMTLK